MVERFWTDDPLHDWNAYVRDLDRNGVTLEEWEKLWREEHGFSDEEEEE